MGNKAIRSEAPVNCLLVEGPNDKHVSWSLLAHHRIPEVFRVEAKEGIESVIKDLDVELDRPGLTHLGIIVDADADLQLCWDNLRTKLMKYGYKTVPSRPGVDGTVIIEEDLPVVGIWVMPENTLPGMLEDFLHFLVPSGDRLWSLAEEVIRQVEAQECRFRPTYRSKAKIHTW